MCARSGKLCSSYAEIFEVLGLTMDVIMGSFVVLLKHLPCGTKIEEQLQQSIPVIDVNSVPPE